MVLLNLKYLHFTLTYLNYGIDLIIQNIPKRSDRSPLIEYQINQMHQLFITKFIDLFDTIFFVLRKKQNHVTVLHLYHHSLVPILYWTAFRLVPTFKPLGIFVVINCFIHVLMYSYYALSSFGPKIQQFLWWKKYITQIQLLQFALLCTYGVFVFIFQQNYPPIAFWLGMDSKTKSIKVQKIINNFLFYFIIATAQPPLFLIMFANFYFKAYNKSKKVH